MRKPLEIPVPTAGELDALATLYRTTRRVDTFLTGVQADQAALHGVLERIGDLNLILLSVRRVEEGDRDSTTQAGARKAGAG
jgi:hypothetical protein